MLCLCVNHRPVKAKKRGGGGFAKVCQLSPQLEKFIGTSQLARTEVIVSTYSSCRLIQLCFFVDQSFTLLFGLGLFD